MTGVLIEPVEHPRVLERFGGSGSARSGAYLHSKSGWGFIGEILPRR